MKRLLFVLSLCLVLCACNKNDSKDVSDIRESMYNKYNFASIEEVNDSVDVNLIRVKDARNERYMSIDQIIGQYTFDLNDYSYTIRGSKQTDSDISGIEDDRNVFKAHTNEFVYMDDCYMYRYFINDRQYTIVLDDANGYNDKFFESFCLEIEQNQSEDVHSLPGEYIDITSQRARLTINQYGDMYQIEVSWSSSANETKYWNMSARLANNRLEYDSENVSIVTFDENGEQRLDATPLFAEGGHYFEINNDKLYWLGATELECTTCIFEKIN